MVNAAVFVLSFGNSVHELRVLWQKSQKLSRSETSPGRRRAIPTITIGIRGSIFPGWQAPSWLENPSTATARVSDMMTELKRT